MQALLLLSLTSLDSTEADLLLKNREDIFHGEMLIHTQAIRGGTRFDLRFTDLQLHRSSFLKR